MRDNPRVIKCSRCGYHYAPSLMSRVGGPGYLNGPRPDVYYCKHRERCDRNLARRRRDQEAVGK